jgi:hypothetical protein
VATGVPFRLAAHLARAALAAAVAAAQFRILVLVLGPQYRASVLAAEGVLRGEPHWRVHQNRLLGPWLVELARPVFGSFERAHVVVSIALLALAGWLLLTFLSRLHAERGRALASYFVAAFLVVCCFGRDWLYVWDLVDLVVFVLFNALVAQRAGPLAFAGLFAVAVFHRETALFVALWMVVDPVVRRFGGHGPLDLRMAGTGAALLVAGVTIVETLRAILLVREVGPEIVGAVAGAGPRAHFMLPDNLRALGAALGSFRFTMSFLVPAAIVAYFVLCVRVAWRDPLGAATVAAIHALILVSLLAFGIVFETRIYLVLIPFVAFWLWPAERNAGRERAPAG